MQKPEKRSLSQYLTRAGAARRLGLSTVRFRQLEKSGRIATLRDNFGRLRYATEKVDQIGRELGKEGREKRSRTPTLTGAMIARIFRMFDERLELRKIVVECEQTPETVLDLRRQHADLGRDFLVTPRVLAELRERLDWHGETDTSLLESVSGRLRHQFERGQAIARPARSRPNRNHKRRVLVNNGESNGRGSAENRGDLVGGEGALHGDPAGETTGQPGTSDS